MLRCLLGALLAGLALGLSPKLSLGSRRRLLSTLLAPMLLGLPLPPVAAEPANPEAIELRRVLQQVLRPAALSVP